MAIEAELEHTKKNANRGGARSPQKRFVDDRDELDRQETFCRDRRKNRDDWDGRHGMAQP